MGDKAANQRQCAAQKNKSVGYISGQNPNSNMADTAANQRHAEKKSLGYISGPNPNSNMADMAANQRPPFVKLSFSLFNTTNADCG